MDDDDAEEEVPSISLGSTATVSEEDQEYLGRMFSKKLVKTSIPLMKLDVGSSSRRRGEQDVVLSSLWDNNSVGVRGAVAFLFLPGRVAEPGAVS